MQRTVLFVGAEVRPHRSWKFRLKSSEGENLEVCDREQGASLTRLELLAAVRGLEALERPTHVTLVTRSNYLRRGIERGLAELREHQWTWESFGGRAPIRDLDLWLRLDRARKFHEIHCRIQRNDPPHQAVRPPFAGKQCPSAPTTRRLSAARQAFDTLRSPERWAHRALGWLWGVAAMRGLFLRNLRAQLAPGQ